VCECERGGELLTMADCLEPAMRASVSAPITVNKFSFSETVNGVPRKSRRYVVDQLWHMEAM